MPSRPARARLLAVVMAVWLVACAGVRAAGERGPLATDIVVTRHAVLQGVAEGHCARYGDGPTRVRVLDSLDPEREAVVLAHELGHALGLDHSENFRSIMWWTGGALCSVCPADVRHALRAPYPMSVASSLPDPEPLRQAVAYWNVALQRTQFVVAP